MAFQQIFNSKTKRKTARRKSAIDFYPLQHRICQTNSEPESSLLNPANEAVDTPTNREQSLSSEASESQPLGCLHHSSITSGPFHVMPARRRLQNLITPPMAITCDINGIMSEMYVRLVHIGAQIEHGVISFYRRIMKDGLWLGGSD